MRRIFVQYEELNGTLWFEEFEGAKQLGSVVQVNGRDVTEATYRIVLQLVKNNLSSATIGEISIWS